MKTDIAEYLALIVLGAIAIVATFELGVDGKEIPLAIGSGIGGYLAKAGVNAIRGGTEPSEPKNSTTSGKALHS